MLEKFYPMYIFNKVEEIPIDLLKRERISAIIFDMDNTLVNSKYKYNKELKIWVKEIKKIGIKTCILSNSPRENKVKQISKELGMKYFHNAFKPWSIGFKKAEKLLEEDKKNIVIIGDQLFTDIYGGNRYEIKTILVTPIEKKEFIMTKLKRPLESIVIRKYLKSKQYIKSLEKIK